MANFKFFFPTCLCKIDLKLNDLKDIFATLLEKKEALISLSKYLAYPDKL